MRFASLPAEVVGYWSLWRIALDNQSLRDLKIIPIFHHDDGRNLLPTARHIWDALMEDRPEVEQVGTKTGTKFLRFLQDEWKQFLAEQADPSQKCRVPFNHEDVRAYIDTFFLDGSLTPVEWDNAANLPAWAHIGVAHDPEADALRRLNLLARAGRPRLRPVALAAEKSGKL